MRIVEIAVVLLAAIAPAWAQVPRTEREVEARWAVCHSDANVDSAIQACTDLLAVDTIRGSSFLRQRVWEKRLSNDGRGGLHKRRGVLSDRKGDLDGAIADYRNAARYLSDDAQAFMLLGGASLRKFDADGAIDAYGEAIKLNPSLTMAFVGRAGAFLVKRDVARAEEDMNRAAAQDPKLIEKLEAMAQNDDLRALLHNARVANAIAPPECDEFCHNLQVVLKARSKGFRDIVGGNPDSLGTSPATVTLSGAEDCDINRKREFTCRFPGINKDEGLQRLDELAKRVKRALPSGWGKAEAAADWLYVFKHDSEKEPSISLALMPDFFTPKDVLVITIKGL